jgi:hypothetical protein
MDHLQILKILNYLSAALQGLVGLLCLAGGVFSGVTIIGLQGDVVSGLITVVVYLVITVFVFAMAGLFVFCGNGVGQGKRRTLQTVLAVLSLGSCPGIFYGIYALWVLWGNEDTKAKFEANAS